MSKKHLFLAGLLVAVIVPMVTLGATIKGGENITIGKGEIIRDNLYVAGGKIFIGESVFGDVLAVGGDITVSGDVAEDMAIAGGSISILGSSGGDIRIAGGDILVTGSTKGDLMVAGGAIDILPEVNVGRDVAIVGGAISFNGTVMGDARITGGRVDIGGNIVGNLTVEAEEIYIRSGATIGGSIVYKGKDETILNVEEGATITGATVYEEGKLSGFADKKTLAAFFGTLVIAKLVSFLAFGILAVIFFKKFSRGIVRGGLEHKGRAFICGLLTLIVTPIVSVILFMTVVGSFIGFILLFSYILVLSLAGVYAGIMLGSWIGKYLQKEGHGIVVDWKYAILGIVALFIIGLIPFVGWVVVLYLVLTALGSITYGLYRSMWLDR